MPVPVDVDIPLATSANVYPTSGSGGYNGPWLEERQSLHYHYVRVPQSTEVGSHILNLSAYTPSVKINSTHLIGWVEAEYSISKTYNSYAASTPYTQPQKFELDASLSGPDNTFYDGTLSSHTFGVIGTCRTKQPYIRRQLWVDASDAGSEVTRSVVACDAMIWTQISGAPLGQEFNYNHNFLEHWLDYEASLMRGGLYKAYAPRLVGLGADGNKHIWPHGGRYGSIYGNYKVGKETNTQMVRYIMDGLGYSIRTDRMVKMQPTNSMGRHNLHPDDLVGIAEYSNSRHAYD